MKFPHSRFQAIKTPPPAHTADAAASTEPHLGEDRGDDRKKVHRGRRGARSRILQKMTGPAWGSQSGALGTPVVSGRPAAAARHTAAATTIAHGTPTGRCHVAVIGGSPPSVGRHGVLSISVIRNKGWDYCLDTGPRGQRITVANPSLGRAKHIAAPGPVKRRTRAKHRPQDGGW